MSSTEECSVSRKRKQSSSSGSSPSPSRKKNIKPVTLPVEKRAARYRSKPSVDIRQRISRALYQRMFLINHSDVASSDSALSKHFAVLGSTGNIYDVVIDQKPHCTCPDFARGHLCKHVLFVILKVLKVPPQSPLVYQKALLQSELVDMFTHAPKQVTAAVVANESVTKAYDESVLGKTSNKEDNIVSSDLEESTSNCLNEECGVCFDSIDSKATATACHVCKKYLHNECLRRWYERSQSCVYCRAAALPSAIKLDNKEGYVNLGAMQGMSGQRDDSTYSSPYRRRYYFE